MQTFMNTKNIPKKKKKMILPFYQIITHKDNNNNKNNFYIYIKLIKNSNTQIY